MNARAIYGGGQDMTSCILVSGNSRKTVNSHALLSFLRLFKRVYER